MTPAQRLAEWLDANEGRSVFVYPLFHEQFIGPEQGWKCALRDSRRTVPCFSTVSRDAAITAALDAWQKGDG